MAAPTLTDVLAAFRVAADDLSALGAPHAVIGGLAVSSRARPRTTQDVDFMVAVPDDRGAEQVVFAMKATGNAIALLLEETRTQRLATARMTSRLDRRVFVDLMFCATGIEAEIVAAATPLDIQGAAAPVATAGHLIAMKLLSRDDVRRDRDRGDLNALIGGATDGDLAQARAAVRLITARGFHQGKALEADLDALIAGRGLAHEPPAGFAYRESH